MRRVILAAVLLLGMAGLAACSGGGGSIGGTRIGETIPESKRPAAGVVDASLLDGTPFTLSADAGRVVVLNFWATWCDVCTVETPHLDALYRTMKSDGVDFVGVDTREVSKASALAFVRDNDISFPSIWDPKIKTAIQLGKLNVPAGLPYTIVIDKHERIAAVYDGKVAVADLKPVLSELASQT